MALDSPHARPPGEYNWQPTLWHELAHVITLQMSNNRIPRWLSEGISQWEEKRARPEWGWEMDVSFAQALDQGKAIKLDELNEAFGDPKLISLAYYQASLVAQYLAETFGEQALHALVRSYSKGITDEQAFTEVFGQTIAQVQVSFDAKMQQTYASTRAALQTAEVRRYAGARRSEEDGRKPTRAASRCRWDWVSRWKRRGITRRQSRHSSAPPR